MTAVAVYARLGNTNTNETDSPKAETQDGWVAVKERDENARKALEVADRLYPGHEWVKVEDGIYLSTRRTIGENSGYERELRNAQLLCDLGSTVYLVPERSLEKGRSMMPSLTGGYLSSRVPLGMTTHWARFSWRPDPRHRMFSSTWKTPNWRNVR